MEKVDKTVRKAVEDGRIHGAVLLAKDLTGRKILTHLRDTEPGKRPPLTPDTPLRLASFSKLLTSIMVLQFVEQGLVDLDKKLDKFRPELVNLKVLTGFDEADNPIERKPKSLIILKCAYSNNSMCPIYTYSHMLLVFVCSPFTPGKWYGDLDKNYKYPLIFDPGTSWAYGPSLDWCSRLIQRASDISA
ncbi:beta-lactamase/transpeptidase-like protein [Xylaria nigripes]|nr:beta-lactamase/transpeptidase-like protein [Xylaria nigripes]